MASTATSTTVHNASLSTFTTALVLNAVIFAIELLVFSIVRKRFKAIYEPRTYIPAEEKRTPPLPEGFLAWPMAVFNADYKLVKAQNGMDAYVFLRFLRMMLKIFIPIWFISWVVLMPIDAVAPTNGLTQLNMFTLGNVAQNPRFSAHVILAWLFTGYIIYIVRQEMRNFVMERQKFLISPAHAATAQANTILITGIPLRYLTEPALTRLFNRFPGGVAKVWLNHNLKEMPDLYTARLKACNKLEAAEMKLIKTAIKLSNKSGGGGNAPPENESHRELAQPGLANILVPQNKRPTHRLPLGPLPFSLPLLGKKVDTIDWAKEEIVRTTTALDRDREILETEELSNGPTKGMKYPAENSAFILFNTQIAAHMAAQTLTHQAPYVMAAKYTEVAPADVIWANLNMNPYESKVRVAISYSATAALIIFWAIPVTFVGSISNVVSQCNVSWLTWLCKIPKVVQGLIQGVLPPVLLAVLNMLLPIILRLMARFEGIPRKTGLELSLMTRFFIFQVVHNFLVLTISSGITSVLKQIADNPGQATTDLAQQLPSASTFFMTYVILQGLTGSAAGFLQIVPLVVYYVKLFLLGSTPRSIYSIKYDLRDVAWGTLFPSITLITVISIAYMIISPIMSGVAVVAFFLFYMMWKYLFLYQLDQPQSGDTGGLFFPKAIQHTMVGLYIQQVCLAVLFFLYPGGKAVGEGIVMIILIAVTVFWHLIINNSFGPLLHSLPLTLSSKGYGMDDDGDDRISMVEAEGFGGDDVNAEKRMAAAAARYRSNSHSSTGEEENLDPRRTADIQTGTVGEASNAYGNAVATEGKRNEGPTDFNHPASVEPQRVIWLPHDSLGLAQSQVEELRELGVAASTQNATIDDKGNTDIQGHPPGMM